jgi:cholesterol transport system auxiliary component
MKSSRSMTAARIAPSATVFRLAGALLIGGLLAGCNILPEQTSIALYSPQPQVATDAAWPTVDWQLSIPRPHADASLDSDRILVCPRPGELQVYKGAAWNQAAPDLVHDVLLRAFDDSGRMRGVARRGEGVNAAYELLLDLRRFESNYTGADGAPHARIELGARLVHNTDNRIVASRLFVADVAADGAEIAQINRAFERGLGETAAQLIGWTLSEGNRDAIGSR